jgi:hypothetical protein
MGGCTNCGAKSGCDHRKAEMLGEVASRIDALYPSRTWGEIDFESALGAGIAPRDLEALAEELAAELNAATVLVAGAEDQLCDFLYVLCMGREPCALQMRELGVAPDQEVAEGERIEELYLRVAVSAVAPFAAVQEVAVELSRSEGCVWLKESPRAGVYAAPLLRRFQRLVALLPTYGLRNIDFGEIASPPQGFSAGEYTGLYGGLPDQVNYLFYPEPSTLVVTTSL